VKQLSKSAGVRDPTLAITQDVNGCHVAHAPAGAGAGQEGEETHIGGIVVVGYCAGVVDAEGVEGRGEGHSVGADKGRESVGEG
jgi:hypothetical protein